MASGCRSNCRSTVAEDCHWVRTGRSTRHGRVVSFKDAVTILAGDSVKFKATPRLKPAGRDDDKSNVQKAAWLWSQRKPITEGTPPCLYLRKRGYTGPIPATLGYLPARDPHPASMIAGFGIADEPAPGIIAAPNTVTGAHLTRLTKEGDKAPDAAGKSKIMVGICKGAPIEISSPNDLLGMAVTEGIEDALSVYQVTGLGVWAAGSAGFMPALARLIPDFIEVVTIYAHDDAAGRRNAIDLARALKTRAIKVLMQGL
jgi:putative DNA primase/helicase